MKKENIMTKEQLAEILNGREYGNEITEAEERQAEENELVVVFGYSDDNMEMRGAIQEEYGCYEGGIFQFDKEGNFPDGETIEAIETITEKGYEVDIGLNNQIEAVWAPDDSGCSWIYKTEIPHAKFNVMEDGEIYCQGIIFSINDLK